MRSRFSSPEPSRRAPYAPRKFTTTITPSSKQLFLKVVRSDNAEVIASGGTVTSKGNIDPAKAVKAATLAAVNEIAPQILDSYANSGAR